MTIHAGETGIGENVYDAITLLKAERIGHGVFIKDCERAYNLVKENNVTLEMCPTSNLQTKAIKNIENYPLNNFHKDGIKVSLNTDNRTVSDIDLTNEYNIIFNNFEMSEDDYKTIYLNSVEASFADENIKNKLRNYIK